MTCSLCASAITDDCRYCPQCGQPTPLGENAQSLSLRANGNSAAIPRAGTAPRALAYASMPEADSVHRSLTQANLHRLRKQWTEAVDCCVTVLRAQPGNQTAHSLLGDIYRDQGKIDDAIQWYRMAVDIWPNASDEAKLRRMEEERSLLMGNPLGGNRNQNSKGIPLPTSSSGTLIAGTTNLMGVSPRRWLRAITLVSLGFVCLMILWLIALQVGGHRVPATTASNIPVRTPATMASSAAKPTVFRSNEVIPFTAAANGASWPKTNSNYGSTSALSALPEIPTTPPTSGGLPSWGQNRATPLEIPPAPVTKVVPLAGSYGQSVEGIGETESASHSRMRTMVLSGGLKVSQSYHDQSNGHIALLLTAPLGEELTGQTRALLLRNVYRSAYNEMEADASLVHATVSVQPENEPGVYLVIAEVERPPVFSLPINTEPVESLEQHLTSIHWLGEENVSGTPAPSNDSNVKINDSTTSANTTGA